ncbi:MAG: bifunctional nuclease family protein [Candidatus Marinimicrobia bacterium]|nr:bifunctional nuclease family protein [Candidatus Neomarinimicrobiota bacterium]
MVRVRIDKIVFYPPSKGYAIILREISGFRQLPIIVGVFEAQAIALSLEKVTMPRPLSHDLFINILKSLDAEIKEVIVTDLIEGTFYAKVIIERMYDGAIFEIDSRPSDSIALALRANAPIYVEEKVMREAGQLVRRKKYEDNIQNMEEIESDDKLSKIFELQLKLQKAIDEENYELAAKIRDEINKLEKESEKN